MSSHPATGQLVYVIGPSGAGKDSLLAWLIDHWPMAEGTSTLPPLHLARRTITRAPSPSGEQHESVDEACFAQLLADGALAMDWAAHGLHYGIRATELAPLSAGACVLVNGSRAALRRVTQRFPDVAVLHITASAPTLQARLLSRQRESGNDVQRRMARTVSLAGVARHRWAEVRNDGAFDTACAQVLAAMRELLSP
jgi:ribose 1,5-bisphosphokinase